MLIILNITFQYILILAPVKFTLSDLEEALKLCTHLIYGFAGINATSGEIISLHPHLDLPFGYNMYKLVLDYKMKFPNVKILLSVGGSAVLEEDESDIYLKVVRKQLKS